MIKGALSVALMLTVVASAGPSVVCPPNPTGPTLVLVEPVVLQSASPTNTTVGDPPNGMSQIFTGPYVIELWATLFQDPSLPAGVGFTCVFSDVTFTPTATTCVSVTQSPLLTDFDTGTCGPSLVDEVGGCNLSDPNGVGDADGTWVRVATINMNADFAQAGNVVSAVAASTTISVFACGNMPASRISFLSANFDIIQPCTTSAQCSDGNLCNGIETCNLVSGQCELGTPVVCMGGDNCNPADGACVECFQDMQCDDNSVCTSNVCNLATFTCEFTSIVDCSDGNLCTQDVCNPSLGTCSNPEIDCSDGNKCNLDSCDPLTGDCIHRNGVETNFELRPGVIAANLGEIITVDLFLKPTDNAAVLTGGFQAVVSWDSSKLRFDGWTDSSPYNWFFIGFQDDSGIDNLNAGLSNPPIGLPDSDGDVFIVAQGQFGAPAGIGSAQIPFGGLLAATFHFEVLDVATNSISIAPTAGTFTTSEIIWGGEDFRCEMSGLPCDGLNWPSECGFPVDTCSAFPLFLPAGCNIANDYGETLVLGPCVTVSDCADLVDNDGMCVGGPPCPPDGATDSNCFWFSCDNNACNGVERVHGDVGGAFGDCALDGFANLFDANQVLACFANVSACEAINIDPGGPFGACDPDGFCNLADANHALLAFANQNPCQCPLDLVGPAPQMAMAAGGESSLTLVADRRVIRAGESVDIDVYLDDAQENIQSYQLHVGASGGRRGQFEVSDVRIDQRWDNVFGAEGDAFEAFAPHNGQMLAGVYGSGIATPGKRYLATFTLQSSENAVGPFVVDLQLDGQTMIVASYTSEIEVKTTTPAVVVVTPNPASSLR